MIKRLLIILFLGLFSMTSWAYTLDNQSDYPAEVQIFNNNPWWLKHSFTLEPHQIITRDMKNAEDQTMWYFIRMKYGNSITTMQAQYMPVWAVITIYQDENGRISSKLDY